MEFATVETLADADFPTRWGHFRILGLRANRPDRSSEEAVALVMGDLHAAPPLVRVHSQCLTGDVFGSCRCDCGPQLHLALRTIAGQGGGVLLYLRQEGRGIGLVNKIRAYALQQAGADTVDANRLLGLPDDARDYAIAAEILQAMGVEAVRLMTNNPAKVAGLTAHGVRVAERLSLETPPTVDNGAYLDTKAQRMGHLLTVLGAPEAVAGHAAGGDTFCLSRHD